MPTKMRPVFFAIWEPLRNLVSLPISTRKAGLSPHGAPSHDHDFELVTPDVRAPLDSWSLHLRYYAVLSKRSFQSGPFKAVLVTAQVAVCVLGIGACRFFWTAE